MAAINFPDSPSDGDTHVVGQVTYTYNSAETKWKTTINSNNFLPTTGGTLTGNLNMGTNDLTVGDVTASGTASLSGLTYPTSDGTASQFLQTNGSGTLSWATPTDTTTNLTRGTAQSLSGSSEITFSSIPSGVRRITLLIEELSDTSGFRSRIRVGTGGTVETTGYLGVSNYNTVRLAVTTEWAIYFQSSGSHFTGRISIENIDGNTWVQTHVGGSRDWTSHNTGAGRITLSGTLDTLSLSLDTGTFDNGTVNIFYEV